jgi:predicted signal transduction protein with EAL and GGDEF domain
MSTMKDVIHFGILLSSVASIGVGLWLISPAAMFIGIGSILLVGVIVARCGWMFIRRVE